jgi:hypothetical protein
MIGRLTIPMATILAVLFVVPFLLQPCETANAGPAGCGQPVVNIQTDANCQVAGFECSVEEYRGQMALRFRFDLINVSGRPQRYRVSITTSSGQTVGGLVPHRSRKRSRVMIDRAVTTSLIMVGVTETPGAINVTVNSVFDAGSDG